MLTSLFSSILQVCRALVPSWRNGITVIPQGAVTVCVVWLMSGSALQAQENWTQLTNPNPSGANGSMLLMTDGTVLVSRSAESASKVWTKLAPDASGNYIHGTWSSNVASMALERFYTGSVVLPTGKLFVLGGEYTGPLTSHTSNNTGEVYNPLTNIWTPTTAFPKTRFGDGQAVLLSNGKILAGFYSGPETYLYDPATHTWAQTGSKLRNDRNDEETWVLLPGGGVLCYEIHTTGESGEGFAQRYDTASGTWLHAGSVPVPLTNATLSFRLGPAGLLPDGRVIQIGGDRHTAIYTPATNTWVKGPLIPDELLGAGDSCGAMLPDGKFIFAAGKSGTAGENGVTKTKKPTKLYSFDYKTNLLTDVTPTGTLGEALANAATYQTRMLVAPNGHLLMNVGGNAIWDYAPAGLPQDSWKPTVTKIVKTATTTYTLTGLRLTGISEGANYGDGAGLSTNYPIVRLKNSVGVVKYARTSNWTPGVSNAGDSTPMAVEFKLPDGLGNGTYQLSVIANGIASTNFTFTTGPSVVASTVTTKYVPDTKTLTLTGDDLANVLSVSLQNGKIKIEAANGTKLTNLNTAQTNLSSTSYSHVGLLVLKAELKGGDDSISMVGIESSTTEIKLGTGADKVVATLCKIHTLLKIDGGVVDGGTEATFWDNKLDSLITTSSIIANKTLSHFP